MLRRLCIAASIVTVTIPGIGVSGAAAADPPPYNGKILVIARDSYPSTGSQIYTINPDGRGLNQLTSGYIDGGAEWSPDGSRIAFSRQPLGYGPSEIWVMNADGSGQTQLTTSSVETDGYYWNVSPTWSADGTQIAFAQRIIAPLSNFSDIMKIPADGSASEIPVAVGRFFAPQWSTDGAKIAYYGHSTLTEPSGLFVSDPDGMNREVIVPDGGGPTDWSPDSQWILSGADQDGDGWWEVVQVSADGETIVDLSGNYPALINPAGGHYAPDGTKVVITANDDACDAYVLNTDGSGSSFNITANTSLCFTSGGWGPTIYPFVDILDNSLRDHILWAFEQAITTGCTETRYCPNAPVTRGQMASFLSRALDLLPTADDFFTDDEGSTHETAINRVAASGITLGCADGLYCPTRAVTRGEMATFLSRAFQLLDATEDYFTDDEGSTHEASINRVRQAGVAFGCTATTYCPSSPVTRAQMAAFLHRAFL